METVTLQATQIFAHQRLESLRALPFLNEPGEAGHGFGAGEGLLAEHKISCL